MYRLIRSECYKLLKSEFYHHLLVVYVLVVFVTLSQVRGTKSAYLLTGYEWFCVRQLMGGWTFMLLSLFVAEYMAADFQNHAFVSTLMCGFTRKEIFRAKGIVCIIGLLGLALTNSIVGLTVTTLLNGFGAEHNANTALLMIKSLIYYLLICIVFIGVITFLAAIFTKNRIGAFGAGYCVCKILGILTANIPYIFEKMKDSLCKTIMDYIVQLTPLYQIDSLMPPYVYKSHPFWLFLLSCSVCFAMAYFISMHRFKRIDFK